MKKEQLTELGIDEEIAKKIMDLNGADIQREGAKLKRLEDERDSLQGQLTTAQETLGAFEGIDPANIKGELQKAKDALKEAQDKHEGELARRDTRDGIKTFFGGLDRKFLNDITRDHFTAEIEKALEDKTNKGKNYGDILDALTKDGEGNPKPGVFADEKSNELLDIPPAGNPPGGADAFKFNFTPINR